MAEGKDNVVSRKVGAVVKLDSLAQLKFNALGRNALPALCQTRKKFAGLQVGANQSFVNGVSHAIECVVVDALRLNDHRQLLHSNNHIVRTGYGCVGSNDKGGDEAGFGEILRVHLFNQYVSQWPAPLQFHKSGAA